MKYEAQKKYHDKVGYHTKGFTLKKELTDAYAEACKKAGVSQAKPIAEFMKQFIEKQGTV